jgi:hypothetical protein
LKSRAICPRNSHFRAFRALSRPSRSNAYPGTLTSGACPSVALGIDAARLLRICSRIASTSGFGSHSCDDGVYYLDVAGRTVSRLHRLLMALKEVDSLSDHSLLYGSAPENDMG